MKKQLYNYLKTSCNCGLTEQHIISGVYSCGQQPHQIIYRAQILGTNNYSAVDLVGLLQRWIQSGTSYIVIQPFRMSLDPTCPTRLDTLDDPECLVGPVTSSNPTTPTFPQTASISAAATEMTARVPAISSKVASPTMKATTITSADNKWTKDVQHQLQQHSTDVSTIAGLFVGSVIGLLLIVLIVLIVIIVIWKLGKGDRSFRYIHLY